MTDEQAAQAYADRTFGIREDVEDAFLAGIAYGRATVRPAGPGLDGEYAKDRELYQPPVIAAGVDPQLWADFVAFTERRDADSGAVGGG